MTNTESIDPASVLEERLLTAVVASRHAEAMDVIETGRVSWKLRDDDNLLVARLKSQLLRSLDIAVEKLHDRGLLTGHGTLNESQVSAIQRVLREPSAGPIMIEDQCELQRTSVRNAPQAESPRQLIGQPASPGLATGQARCVRGREDLRQFQQGEILVCDAIQPTMTHLVPLAGAIVERRGGMLIHGAIIARELGIPCVNGVRNAADISQNGDLVTVDGHLGIVTVGAPDFGLEPRAE